MRIRVQILLSIATLALSYGCGGEDGGETPCGEKMGRKHTCTAGSWCSDESMAMCSPGCRTAANCPGSQLCQVSALGGVGQCQDSSPELQKSRCTTACSAFECGNYLTMEEIDACKASCGQDAERDSVLADCVLKDVDCSGDLVECLGDRRMTCTAACEQASSHQCEGQAVLSSAEKTTCEEQCDNWVTPFCWLKTVSSDSCTRAEARACFDTVLMPE